MRVGIVGLGYVGLPLAVAFAAAGVEVVARRHRCAARSRRSPPGARTSRTSPTLRLAAVLPRLLATHRLRAAGAARRGADLRADAAQRQPRAGPRPAARLRRGARRRARRRAARRARVDDLPGHHARAGRAAAGARRPARRRRLPSRLLARARRPGPHRLHARQHAEGRRRPDRGLRRPRRGSSTGLVCDRGRARRDARSRRSWRSCSRTSSGPSTSRSSTSWRC